MRIEATKLFAPIHEFPDANGNYPPHYDGGSAYHGRGFLQLTHLYNYRAYGDLLGVDLVQSPDLALDPDIAARVLASYFAQRGIADMARRGDWAAVRKAVQGGAAGLALFKQSVAALEDVAGGDPPAAGPHLVAPVVAQNQFDCANYSGGTADCPKYAAYSCSAASLAAVLTAYGQSINISGGLKLIRATGDAVLTDAEAHAVGSGSGGLQNRNGQAQAIADVLTAAGLRASTHPQDELTRDLVRSLLPEHPIVCQMQVLHGGHYLCVTNADDGGVDLADSNAGPGRWTRVDWSTFWGGMGNGRATWVD